VAAPKPAAAPKKKARGSKPGAKPGAKPAKPAAAKGSKRKSAPAPSSSCLACNMPDAADDMTACEDCQGWAHFTCARRGGAFFHRDAPWRCPVCAAAMVVAARRNLPASGAAAPPAVALEVDLADPLVAKLSGFWVDAPEVEAMKKRRNELLSSLPKVPDPHFGLTIALTSHNRHFDSKRFCWQSDVVDVVLRLTSFVLSPQLHGYEPRADRAAVAGRRLADIVEQVDDEEMRRRLAEPDVRRSIYRTAARLARMLCRRRSLEEARREVVATKRSRTHCEMKGLVFGLLEFCARSDYSASLPFHIYILISRPPCKQTDGDCEPRGCDRFLKAIGAPPRKVTRSLMPGSVRPEGTPADAVAWLSSVIG